MTEFHCRVDGNPVAQGRPRLTTRGRFLHAYDPEKSRDWKRTVHYAVCQQMSEKRMLAPIDGPLALAIRFDLMRPKSVRSSYPAKRPDIDNLVKACTDALNGVLWRDDSQIVELAAEKRYAERPGVEIHVRALDA